MLTVEVKGISFENKGAELMLHAIQHEFERRGVAARFVVEPIGDYQRRTHFGLWQKTRYIKRRVNWLAPLAMLPRGVRAMLGLVNANEIDVVLDASGFSYGEQWNPIVAKDRLASTIQKMRKQGTKVIVMPQALGPFESPLQKRYFGEILRHANKVFARDQHSFGYAQSLLSDGANANVLEQCCDFTNIISGIVAAEFVPAEHQVCFIPNSKMLEKRTDGDAYLSFMVALIESALKSGDKPFMLIHEAEADRQLAARIQERLSQPVPVLDPQHALKIKWIIGQSKLVVSSRFHGLVSALSQGVPVVATGWSHKYQELLNDYAVGDWLFDVSEQAAKAETQMQQLLSDAEMYAQTKRVIMDCSSAHKQRVTQAWDTIFSIIQA